MPIPEYEEYIKFLNKYYEEQNRSLNSSTTPSTSSNGTNKFGTLPQ